MDLSFHVAHGRLLLLTETTAANLLAGPALGSLAGVSDATSDTVGAVVVGGGTKHVLARFDGTVWRVLGGAASGASVASGGLLGVQILSGAGTYTPTPGTAAIIVEGWGGGGGGSGVANANVNEVNLGGGGGGGGYGFKRLTSGFAGLAYSVGAGGTGGAAGNNAGQPGGATTFGSYSAPGGLGGSAKGSFAPPITQSGGHGGTPTGWDFNVTGNSGTSGQAANFFTGWASGGGASWGGSSADQSDSFSAQSRAGANGYFPGGGGSGAVSANNGGTKAGGTGAAGCLRIWEYS